MSHMTCHASCVAVQTKGRQHLTKPVGLFGSCLRDMQKLTMTPDMNQIPSVTLQENQKHVCFCNSKIVFPGSGPKVTCGRIYENRNEEIIKACNKSKSDYMSFNLDNAQRHLYVSRNLCHANLRLLFLYIKSWRWETGPKCRQLLFWLYSPLFCCCQVWNLILFFTWLHLQRRYPAFFFNIHWLLIIKGMYLNYKYTSYTEVGKADI